MTMAHVYVREWHAVDWRRSAAAPRPKCRPWTFRFSGVAYAKLTPDHESAAGSSPVVAISHWLLLLLSPLLSAISRRMARAWHA